MSQRPEALVWSRVAREMRGRWVYSRHEDRVSPGVPDVSFVLPDGRAGWLELKAARGNRALLTRPVQIEWALARAEYGVLVMLLAGRDSDEWAAVKVSKHVASELRAPLNFDDLARLGRRASCARELIEGL